jgi:hypothetical protein
MIVRLPGREAEDEIPNPVGGPTAVTVFETAAFGPLPILLRRLPQGEVSQCDDA